MLLFADRRRLRCLRLASFYFQRIFSPPLSYARARENQRDRTNKFSGHREGACQVGNPIWLETSPTASPERSSTGGSGSSATLKLERISRAEKAGYLAPTSFLVSESTS